MIPTQLILGTAQLGMRYSIANTGSEPNQRHAFSILDAALEAGIGGIDTAPDYGHAETWLGEFLRDKDTGWRIATKLPGLPPNLGTGELVSHIERCLLGSLRRLGVERIDRYLIHQSADLVRYGDSLVETLAAHVHAGRIGQLGVSVYSPEEAGVTAQWAPLTVVQHPLNLLDQRLLAHPITRDLASISFRVEARSVLLQGLLRLEPTDSAVRRVGAGAALTGLRQLTAEFGYRTEDIALPWVFAVGAHSALIGVDNARQLDALVGSLSTQMPDALLTAIAALPAPPETVIDPRKWSAE